MHKTLLTFLLTAATLVAAAATSETVLDGAWEFRPDGGTWSTVRVPHDWGVYGKFLPEVPGTSGKLPWKNAGEYRRTFDFAGDLAAGERVYLEFDGVMSRAKVKLNGRGVGGWDYGYASFVLDVTDSVKAETNLLEVAATTREQAARWYPGGGIYRSVRLVRRGPGHALPGSVAITTPEVSRKSATVKVRWETVDGPEERTFTVANPRLWDVDDPHLYTYEIAGETFRYGIRTAAFTADDGFHLNGRRVQLKGVCLHSDLGPLGMAFHRDAMKRQLLCMKDMGANAVRTSHNCPAPQLLDLCDEMGLVVWDECFDKWDALGGRRDDEILEEYVERNLRAFVRRDRNHPCVVAWSIGNEIGNATPNYPQGVRRDRCRRFREAVLREDATRPVGIAAWEKEALDAFADLDLTGWNYARRYLPMKEKYPQKPIVYTESASAFSSFGFYQLPMPRSRTDYAVGELKTDGYDTTSAPYSDIPDVEFNLMEHDRYVAGEFVWTGIDYLGEPTPYDDWCNSPYLVKPLPLGHNQSRSAYYGIADLCVIPKDRWYLYRSHWNTKAETVHILPHWNWGKGRETGGARRVVPVYVYTSGDEAELFLNGKSLGRRRKNKALDYPPKYYASDLKVFEGEGRDNPYYRVMDRYRLRWLDVAYEPGELKAVCYRAGKKIGETSVRTAGKPAALQLTLDPYNVPGSDLVFVQVDVVDAAGVRVPDAMDRVRFRIEGAAEIESVGNADPRDYDSFKDVSSHRLYYGKALVILRRTGGGTTTLRAEADGLKPAALDLAAERRISRNP